MDNTFKKNIINIAFYSLYSILSFLLIINILGTLVGISEIKMWGAEAFPFNYISPFFFLTYNLGLSFIGGGCLILAYRLKRKNIYIEAFLSLFVVISWLVIHGMLVAETSG